MGLGKLRLRHSSSQKLVESQFILNLVKGGFWVLIGDTSIVDTLSSLLKAWKQSFGLGDGNLIASLGG